MPQENLKTRAKPSPAFAELTEIVSSKVARNVLNAPAVAEFLQKVAADRLSHLGDEKKAQLTQWLASAGRKWMLRDGAAKSASRADAIAAGNPEWAREALKNAQPVWVVSLGDRQKAQFDHIADWLAAEAPTRQLNKLSFAVACEKVAEWDAARVRRAEKGADLPDDPDGIEELGAAPDSGLPGAKWARVFSEKALDREGVIMRHCVGSFAERVAQGDCEIYSLRDGDNVPVATLEARSLDHDGLRRVAKEQGWSDEKLAAALQEPSAMEIVQARGVANSALPASASAALADLDKLFRALKRPPMAALAEMGEGGLLPHPTRIGFIRWSDVEPGSRMPGRSLWSSTMGPMPENLTFDILEIGQIDETTPLPQNLAAKNLVLGPSVKALDAREWNIENVFLPRSGPFVARRGAKLKFGAVKELVLELAGMEDGRMPAEWVDPEAETPFALLEARAERFIAPTLRCDELRLSETRHLDLRAAWLKVAKINLADNAIADFTGSLAERMNIDGANFGGEWGDKNESGGIWKPETGPRQSPAKKSKKERQTDIGSEKTAIEQNAQEDGGKEGGLSAQQKALARELLPTLSQKVMSWRPDQGRDIGEMNYLACVRQASSADLFAPEIAVVREKDGNLSQRSALKKLTREWSIANQERADIGSELTRENSLGRTLPALVRAADETGSTFAVLDRARSAAMVPLVPIVRNKAIALLKSVNEWGNSATGAPPGYDDGSMSTASKTKGSQRRSTPFSREKQGWRAMGENAKLFQEMAPKQLWHRALNPSDSPFFPVRTVLENKQKIVAPVVECDLDRWLPFDESGQQAVANQTPKAETPSRRFTDYREAYAPQAFEYATGLALILLAVDEKAPLREILPEFLRAVIPGEGLAAQKELSEDALSILAATHRDEWAEPFIKYAAPKDEDRQLLLEDIHNKKAAAARLPEAIEALTALPRVGAVSKWLTANGALQQKMALTPLAGTFSAPANATPHEVFEWAEKNLAAPVLIAAKIKAISMAVAKAMVQEAREPESTRGSVFASAQTPMAKIASKNFGVFIESLGEALRDGVLTTPPDDHVWKIFPLTRFSDHWGANMDLKKDMMQAISNAKDANWGDGKRQAAIDLIISWKIPGLNAAAAPTAGMNG